MEGNSAVRSACGLLLFSLLSCGCVGKPSANNGKAALESALAGAATILEYKKTDGQAAELLGIKGYIMKFEAKAKVKMDINEIEKMGQNVTGNSYEVSMARLQGWQLLVRLAIGSSGSAMAGAAMLGQGGPQKGAEVTIRGIITFAKSEQGWQPTLVEAMQ